MRKLRILHVDDDGSVRRPVRRWLEDEGHTVKSYAHLTAAKMSGHMDLYIVDGNIGGNRNGVEWAKKLKSQGHKVIILSGSSAGVPTHITYINKSAGYRRQLLAEVNQIARS